jgi:hypothetical protein
MIQSDKNIHKGLDGEHVLIRRPAIPRWWNPIARPHVAVLMTNPVTGETARYYLSRKGNLSSNGRILLEVSDIEGLGEGTLLEIRFDSMKANLYKLEYVDGVPCWRWIERSRGLNNFEYPSMIDWNSQNVSQNIAITL